jgi:hypothetical protein
MEVGSSYPSDVTAVTRGGSRPRLAKALASNGGSVWTVVMT